MDRQAEQDLVIKLALGELGETDRARAEAMAERDGELGELVREVRSAVESMRGDESVSAPKEVRERAKRLMTTAAAAPDWLEKVSRVMATLVLRPSAGAMAGFRGGEAGGVLEYASGSGTVRLMVSASDVGESRWHVRGAVESLRGAASEVLLIPKGEAGGATWHGSVDADGNFRVDVPPGAFRVVVRLGEEALEIPELRIG